jgi:ribose 5-phosphate isomerase B
VEDDDANVMTLGERIIGVSLAREVVKAFLDARFSGLPRHVRRLEKVKQIELDARTGAYDFPEVKE